MANKGPELWRLFQKYKDTPLEYSHATSKIEASDLQGDIREEDDAPFPILEEAVLHSTRNTETVRHLIGLGVDWISQAHVIIWNWFVRYPDELYDILKGIGLSPNQVSPDLYSQNWSPTSAIKCAVIGGHHRWLRILLEYGCKLPVFLNFPDWAIKVDVEVRQRRIRCQNAVLIVLGIAKFRRPQERDTLRIIARQLSSTQRADEWLL
jgi:hypothetical protein